jgi:hypothetical protein
MSARVTQAQADDAAAEAARFWPEFGRRWPWTRAPEVSNVYQQAGEQTVALLRAFPGIQWSNQARWYRRDVRDTPAIIALTPDALQTEVRNLSHSVSAMEGKHVHTLIYLVDEAAAAVQATEPPVAKTLLASTALDAPFYIAQLAHELLNCFCHTEWDGQTLRSGLRRASDSDLAGNMQGAALNDLLLDAILIHYLPVATSLRLPDLLDGAQGPYWRIAQTLSARLRGVPAMSALFSGAPDILERFNQGMTLALDTPDAADTLDTLAAAHDWAGIQRVLGDAV